MITGRKDKFDPFVEIIRWLEIDIRSKVILLEKPGITTLSKSKGISLKKNKMEKFVLLKIKIYYKAIVIKTQKA